MAERTTPKIPIELAWDEYVAFMEGRLHGQTDAFKFAWKAAEKRILQLIKELRPAVKSLEGMGKGKTTDEWFDLLVKDIEEKNT